MEVEMLPIYCRYYDFKTAKIVKSRKQLKKMQETEGFPLGVLFGPNTRVWPVAEVEAWLASRSTGPSSLVLERAAKSTAAKRAKAKLNAKQRREVLNYSQTDVGATTDQEEVAR
jgi:hypothetical protein